MKKESFSESTYKTLEQDKKIIEKTASKGREFLKGILPHLGVAAGAAALSGGYSYLTARSQQGKRKENLNDSYRTLQAMNPDYIKNMDMFKQRFSELSFISPSVATNPQLANKVLKTRIKSGFDLHDIERLSSIEFNARHTPRLQAPSVAALSGAENTFKGFVGMLAPAAVVGAITSIKDSLSSDQPQQPIVTEPTDEQIRRSIDFVMAEKLKEKAEAKAKAKLQQDDLTKKSSADLPMVVSQECLGSMLADRYIMLKTANIASVGKAAKGFISGFSSGGESLKKYVHTMAPALAIAGGIKLVSELAKQKNNETLNREALHVFNGLKKDSELIKSNPSLALEAFDVLRTLSPTIATKPLIARTFLEQTINSQFLNVDQAKQLAQTEQTIQENKGIGGGFVEGLKEPMSLFSYNWGGKSDSKPELKKKDGGPFSNG
jgi:hypothetical protein